MHNNDTVCTEEQLAAMEKEADASADNVIKQVTAKNQAVLECVGG